MAIKETATQCTSVPISGTPCILYHGEQNPSGSFKDRGIWPLIASYVNDGYTSFCISSSGNAALSAATYCSLHNLKLTVFLSPRSDPEKQRRLQELCSDTIALYLDSAPRKAAFQYARSHAHILITTSTDDRCLPGYANIVAEFPETTRTLFIPASSGALAVGLFQGYTQLFPKRSLPRFFIVQTPRVHALLPSFPPSPQAASCADAISDRVGVRKYQIENILTQTKGCGIVVKDVYIHQAQEILRPILSTPPSPNGSLAVAAYLQLHKENPKHAYTLSEDRDIVFLYTGP